MTTNVSLLKLDPDAKKAFEDLANDLANLRTVLTAVRTDAATLRTAFNTAITKMNADAGITDVDYAACAAFTSAAPSTLNVQTP